MSPHASVYIVSAMASYQIYCISNGSFRSRTEELWPVLWFLCGFLSRIKIPLLGNYDAHVPLFIWEFDLIRKIHGMRMWNYFPYFSLRWVSFHLFNGQQSISRVTSLLCPSQVDRVDSSVCLPMLNNTIYMDKRLRTQTCWHFAEQVMMSHTRHCATPSAVFLIPVSPPLLFIMRDWFIDCTFYGNEQRWRWARH